MNAIPITNTKEKGKAPWQRQQKGDTDSPDCNGAGHNPNRSLVEHNADAVRGGDSTVGLENEIEEGTAPATELGEVAGGVQYSGTSCPVHSPAHGPDRGIERHSGQ